MARRRGRPPIYGRRIRLYVTPEQLELLNRETGLMGVTTSAVLRAALDAWFEKPTGERRAS